MFSRRTVKLMDLDRQRLRARVRHPGQRQITPSENKLHLGCGGRRVAGWLNVDVVDSDYDVDLASGRLPWRDAVFGATVSQHLIEHLELVDELLPLLRELRRTSMPSGELWLSCPDIEKVCRSYLEHRGTDLLEDRKPRWPSFSLGEIPSSHIVNHLFHQDGEHKNLYDFELLDWALTKAGWAEVRRVAEADLLARFPEFPPRNDDLQSIYVRAVAAPASDAERAALSGG